MTSLDRKCFKMITPKQQLILTTMINYAVVIIINRFRVYKISARKFRETPVQRRMLKKTMRKVALAHKVRIYDQDRYIVRGPWYFWYILDRKIDITIQAQGPWHYAIVSYVHLQKSHLNVSHTEFESATYGFPLRLLPFDHAIVWII